MLLKEKFLETMTDLILVTGKGIPDLNTRQFVHKLWDDLRLPTFAVVDADPYGIEIMCVYRYGSLSMAWSAETTAVPELKWLGLHPSDLQHLEPHHLKPMTDIDRQKWSALTQRPYMQPDLLDQLQFMADHQSKAEIQSLPSPSRYIFEKLHDMQWI